MTRRQKAIGFFVALCVLLVAAAVSLNITWIMSERRVVALVFGMVLFAFIIAGLIIYTVFLVMEIQRNEEHDSFINAVTHELKTPIASVRLYLQTLQSREVSDEKRREFYDIMLADADAAALHGRPGPEGRRGARAAEAPSRATVVDVAALTRECVELADAAPPPAAGHDRTAEPRRAPAERPRRRRAAAHGAGQPARQRREVFGPGRCASPWTWPSPAPHTVWVRVQDRGIGIPKRQLKRIFNRFYRVPSLRHRRR